MQKVITLDYNTIERHWRMVTITISVSCFFGLPGWNNQMVWATGLEDMQPPNSHYVVTKNTDANADND